MKDGDFVIGRKQPLHQRFANKQRSADYENAHRASPISLSAAALLSRNIRDRGE
jgi:hypothetical protein